MKHIIVGGSGFVGRHLAADLVGRGAEVVVADIERSDLPHYAKATFIAADVTDAAAVQRLPILADDMVYNLSARMLSPIMPRRQRHDFFWPVNYHGTENILAAMAGKGAHRLVHFTTDMIYGPAQTVPQREDHPKQPLGEYGASKLRSEELCRTWRQRGMAISIFRPRLIIGPGRLGILARLFRLIDLGLPIPMIGSGRNPYQFISVYDCASAARLGFEAGVPNGEYNLGSDDPPPVRELLRALIRRAGSRSVPLPTPAPLVKAVLGALDLVNLPLMDPEQYLIADEMCILDTRRAKTELGWWPAFTDTDMLIAAYDDYAAKRHPSTGRGIAAARIESRGARR